MADLVCRHIKNETINVRGQKEYAVDGRGVCLNVSEAHAEVLLENTNWRRLPGGAPAQKASAPEPEEQADATDDLPEPSASEETSSSEDEE